MLLKSTFSIAISTSVLAFEQYPIPTGPRNFDLIKRLTLAKIIPSIIDVFTPVVEISAHWDYKYANYGNVIDVKELQDQPDILLHKWFDAEFAEKHKYAQITLALTDPDAPSRDNNTWSQVCHWLVTNVPYQDADALEDHERQTETYFRDIIEYKPPGPPAHSGPHRYVLVALTPVNGTTKKLHLRTPTDRFRWGYEQAGAGVREYAFEHGLGVIGANYFVSQEL